MKRYALPLLLFVLAAQPAAACVDDGWLFVAVAFWLGILSFVAVGFALGVRAIVQALRARRAKTSNFVL